VRVRVCVCVCKLLVAKCVFFIYHTVKRQLHLTRVWLSMQDHVLQGPWALWWMLNDTLRLNSTVSCLLPCLSRARVCWAGRLSVRRELSCVHHCPFVSLHHRRAHMVTDGFNKLDGVTCNFTEGAMYSFPQVRQAQWHSSSQAGGCHLAM
jgi:hypothetical protein